VKRELLAMGSTSHRRNAVLLTVALTFALSCAVPPRLMTFAEYRKTRHDIPCILEGSLGQGHLFYYGAAHVFDAGHQQIEDILKRWSAFRPTLALNEGGTPPVFDTIAETVGRNGESALVRWLARRDGIPVETFEPARTQLAEAVRGRFTVEQQKVSLVLRQILLQQQRTKAEFRAQDLQLEVTRVLGILNRTPGLEEAPHTFDDFQRSVAQLLPQLNDWRVVPNEWFDPAAEPPPTWVNELARAGSDFRDEFIMNTITGKMRRGHRVFAVIGASHVVMQEHVLRQRMSHVTTQCGISVNAVRKSTRTGGTAPSSAP
jgi:hypothetical protein